MIISSARQQQHTAMTLHHTARRNGVAIRTAVIMPHPFSHDQQQEIDQ